MVVTALALPAPAQEAEEGYSLMEEGARLFMRGLMREVEPALDGLTDLATELEPQMRAFVDEMGPRLTDLLGLIDDIQFYEAPEMLENGDIIIRRRPDAPPLRDTEQATPEIEL